MESAANSVLLLFVKKMKTWRKVRLFLRNFTAAKCMYSNQHDGKMHPKHAPHYNAKTKKTTI